jgi:tRNA (cmo5U34)-methyltransferase
MRKAVPLYDRLQDEVVRATSDVQTASILDLGAGTGETTRRCLAAHPGATAVLVDASAEMLAIAGQRLGAAVELKLGRLEDSLPPGRFDVIVSVLAVHHLPSSDKADFFARVARRLSPGGRFVIGDVVVTDTPVFTPAPLDPAVDFPDCIADQLAWLRRVGLQAHLHWADADLAVVSGSLRRSAGFPGAIRDRVVCGELAGFGTMRRGAACLPEGRAGR